MSEEKPIGSFQGSPSLPTFTITFPPFKGETVPSIEVGPTCFKVRGVEIKQSAEEAKLVYDSFRTLFGMSQRTIAVDPFMEHLKNRHT